MTFEPIYAKIINFKSALVKDGVLPEMIESVLAIKPDDSELMKRLKEGARKETLSGFASEVDSAMRADSEGKIFPIDEINFKDKYVYINGWHVSWCDIEIVEKETKPEPERTVQIKIVRVQ